MIDNDDDSRYS
jgi:hypothetical protein